MKASHRQLKIGLQEIKMYYLMLLPGLISWRGGKYCAEVDEGDLQQVFLWKYLMICKQLQHVDHQSSGRKR